jgi:glyoxylase-like metal-dependent hydrolase (beta-lactamase superfamily II)
MDILRRYWISRGLGVALGTSGLAVGSAVVFPGVRAFADSVDDFIRGPAVADIAPERLSERVYMLYSKDGFPTPENKGVMCNIIFVVTQAGVVVLDSGGSVQIGEMALRVIKQVTPKPVVAVFNSHYHGDHWLGNHAFVNAYGPDLPIYSLEENMRIVKGVEGSLWLRLMEQWTNQATLGTKIVPPNKVVSHGQELGFGDTRLRMHFYGTAHTPCDLSVEVVEDGITYVGDVAMQDRIANIDDGSYPGTFKYYEGLKANTRRAKNQTWIPGHGRPSTGLLDEYAELLLGIWETCLRAVEDGKDLSAAKALVLKDPRVQSRAARTAGFESNIGKYTSLAFLEAEKVAF